MKDKTELSLTISQGGDSNYQVSCLTCPTAAHHHEKPELDKPKSNCGIVGVYNHPQAAVISYYALHSLQHRGQEAAGILAARWENG
ncbi:MAG: hypothetical protein Q8919_11440, partial [Bacteroidota bacterium]|nr:hypothetical protein [Bacteroidota bacterium]